jgi:prepilin-type N-terminal cleavage/methylation domain-containing protein
MISFLFKNNKGFTLIETMVAVSIFTIAIIGPFSVAERSLNAANTARDELIASQLAQEGLEAIRFERDSSYLTSPSTWTATSSLAVCLSPKACTIDLSQTPQNLVKGCTNGICKPFYLSPSGLYYYPSSPAGLMKSRFVRTITIDDSPGQTSVERANVTVAWTTAQKTHTTTLTEDFYDWF